MFIKTLWWNPLDTTDIMWITPRELVYICLSYDTILSCFGFFSTVRNQEDVESGYNDGESEEEQGEPQKHAELSGEHSEPSVHKGGETEGNDEPKEDHQEAREKEGKPDQEVQKWDHEQSDQFHLEIDQRKPR